MPPRTVDQILEAIVAKTGKEARFLQKLTSNKERNWLLAIFLNSFAKLASNELLTDLDECIVNAFHQNGFDDECLREYGRISVKMPVQLRNEIFPSKFAQLTPKTKYTFTNLKEDAPNIVKSILGMENISKVNLGTMHPSEYQMVPINVLKKYGSAVTILVPSFHHLPPEVFKSKFTIKAIKFRCNDETGMDWPGSDEPYWIFSSIGNDIAVTTRSQVFEDIDSGDERNFGDIDGKIWGPDGMAQELPDGEIGSLISLFEHDCGDPDTVRGAVAAAFAAAGRILKEIGIPAWIVAVVTGVGEVIAWLLKFLDDDHIADQVFVFNRNFWLEQLPQPNTSTGLVRRFTDGDGDYTLTISVKNVGIPIID